jgi:hypothetical protein
VARRLEPRWPLLADALWASRRPHFSRDNVAQLLFTDPKGYQVCINISECTRLSMPDDEIGFFFDVNAQPLVVSDERWGREVSQSNVIHPCATVEEAKALSLECAASLLRWLPEVEGFDAKVRD